MFKGILLEQGEGGKTLASLKDLDEAALPEGDVRVAVNWSSLNYKDALAITGRSPIVRKWPMVPGIDFAGTVEQSSHPLWKVGDPVVLTGFGVGEGHWGGLAQRAQVKGDWLVGLPAGLDAKHAMAVGTAGFTAMLCVMALERHGVKPADGPVVVTGATGGVGSVAIAILARLGFTVHAVTGRPQEADYLKSLGASEIVAREELTGAPRPLNKERWAGGVDAVGSAVLANVLSMTRYGGAVAACGLAGGMDLPTSVAPFILRGVCLLGIDSVMAPVSLRREAWKRLETDLDRSKLAAMTTEIPLSEVPQAARRLLAGEAKGRIVVKIG